MMGDEEFQEIGGSFRMGQWGNYYSLPSKVHMKEAYDLTSRKSILLFCTFSDSSILFYF